MSLETPILTGSLDKRCGGRTPKWKERWCKLFPSSLQVFSKSGKRAKLHIELDRVTACERVDKGLLDKDYVIQIGYVEGEERDVFNVIYLSGSESEVWRKSVSRILQKSADSGAIIQLQQTYHPGVYVSRRWNCCYKREDNADGCKETTTLDAGTRLSLNRLSLIGSNRLSLTGSRDFGSRDGIPGFVNPAFASRERFGSREGPLKKLTETHYLDGDDAWGTDNIF